MPCSQQAGLAVTMLPGVAEAAEMAEAAAKAAGDGSLRFDAELYHRFANPDSVYRPFVRWWWNGDKVEPEELRRELRVMKAAGIGGVEINPIGIAEEDNDMGKRSLTWLSDEWIEALKATFDEAKKLDMTCDLIVGSGWPFGGEFLKGDERAQVVLIDAQKLEGRPRSKSRASRSSARSIRASRCLSRAARSNCWPSS